MAVHKLTMVQRPSGQARAANPFECRAHFAVGWLAGLLNVWNPPAALIAA
jgi:hypothetical protein